MGLNVLQLSLAQFGGIPTDRLKCPHVQSNMPLLQRGIILPHPPHLNKGGTCRSVGFQHLVQLISLERFVPKTSYLHSLMSSWPLLKVRSVSQRWSNLNEYVEERGHKCFTNIFCSYTEDNLILKNAYFALCFDIARPNCHRLKFLASLQGVFFFDKHLLSAVTHRRRTSAAEYRHQIPEVHLVILYQNMTAQFSCLHLQSTNA